MIKECSVKPGEKIKEGGLVYIDKNGFAVGIKRSGWIKRLWYKWRYKALYAKDDKLSEDNRPLGVYVKLDNKGEKI